ncbi:hypothetical protein LIA77_07900 [Sarocladium implicatum]|nr:hypothetical protein LIA77_07900 [Sarocladium implicatum]
MSIAARVPTALATASSATTASLLTTARSSASTAFTRPIAPTSLAAPSLLLRNIHTTTPSPLRAPEPSDNPGAMPDGLSERPAKGATGGGDKLGSSAEGAPPKPKILSASVKGVNGQEGMSEEQKSEVERHNKEFEEKHGRADPAEDDKVDKKFWSDDRGKE